MRNARFTFYNDHFSILKKIFFILFPDSLPTYWDFESIKITNHNRDWVKALNEPLIMSTTQMRITGGDHLVEMGSVPVRLVTRGQVSVRMDTRRNIRVIGREARVELR